MINRKLYSNYFTKDDLPEWMCPTCNKSILQLKNDSDFIKRNDSTTELHKKEEYFDWVEHAKLFFTAILQCANDRCKETVMLAGEGHIEENYYTNEHGQDDYCYETYYKPKFFYPPLNFFIIPDDTPENVSKTIIESFSLFFTNKSASANQIRIALEDLLTHLGIPKEISHKKRLTLHNRVELLSETYPNIKDLCMAVKWLGNDGSHSGDKLEEEQIYNVFDLIEYILYELYDNSGDQIKKMAQEINEARGV